MVQLITPKTRVFDWYSRWQTEVEPALKQPRVQDALDVVMAAHCLDIGETWDREECPAAYADPFPSEYYIGHPVERYRMWAGCHVINVWAGVLGQEIAPALDWAILSRGGDKHHSMAVGMRNDKIELIMDLVWIIPHPIADVDEAVRWIWKDIQNQDIELHQIEERLDLLRIKSQTKSRSTLIIPVTAT